MRNFTEVPDAPTLAEIEKMVEAKDVRGLAAAYRSLLGRVRLAELVLYRGRLLAQDELLEVEQSARRRSGPATGAGIANLTFRYARDYIEPVIGLLREPLGFEDGDEAQGWYLPAEDVRAKLVGNERAKDRLAREGRPGLPG